MARSTIAKDDEEKNRAIIESLLKSFDIIARRLTPQVEPALIYSPGKHIDASIHKMLKQTDDSE